MYGLFHYLFQTALRQLSTVDAVPPVGSAIAGSGGYDSINKESFSSNIKSAKIIKQNLPDSVLSDPWVTSRVPRI